MSFWNDVLGVLTGGASTAVEAGAGSVGSGLSDIDKVGTVFGTFFNQITKASMWRSLAWLLLGIILFTLGLLLLLRKPVEQGVGEVAKAVAL